MKREIKFRAWTNTEMTTSDKYQDMSEFWFDCAECEIMQYTGKDKNGVEIYEGDIVYIAGIGNCEVNFNCSAWAFENKDSITYFNELEWNDVGSIIGNIYENKDLLTKTP